MGWASGRGRGGGGDGEGKGGAGSNNIDNTWVNYNDLTRPHPKWWVMWEITPQPPYFRLVKYYNSPRLVMIIGMIMTMIKYSDENENKIIILVISSACI